MKKSHEFLNEFAANKVPYVSTEYYELLIEKLNEEKKPGYLNQIQQLVSMSNH